ncbi:Zn-ribbon domain-containing OB-fold protein [Nocardioides sp. cx-173]|uniref:Zn-ribbon domain-containing OB-fold protein n=1 Tax=Nocardioides sp. cx-173 TaxID=2898796 RepID=UPI001E299717|nr:OB-fold domain-containing protein [Nocardioides sp. cx-173]MCD4524366.1 OB-fold domain-containing protein [Nocardioides sp. cx-173]UGB43146.1 OB-fold domain-containing protein [Nocardioides sp. cx-173]
MSDWVPGAVPPADETTAAYWAATGEHRLTVQACTACETVQHPPRALCTGCGSMDDLVRADAAGTGVVDAFTVVHRAPRPELSVPYTLARVRLAEGPVVLTRLEPAEPGEQGWRTGDPVAVAWADLPDGRALPYFIASTHPAP